MIDVVILVGAFVVAAIVLRGVQAWLDRPGEDTAPRSAAEPDDARTPATARRAGVRERAGGVAVPPRWHRWRPRRG
ncbi:hypothetical protein [Saccharopolyspora rosea]|uniref:Uncharacterized protein n=1 Tax=Saccharopolyspora rosea TaxID=524884 RepID=A0ABW3G0F5_9PSEU|nr:hypothetical protein [Saccharopolyspora rosea]